MNIRYVLRGLLRHQIPDKWFFAWMRLSGASNSSETDPDQAFSQLKQCLDSIGVSLRGKHLLDVGSGRYARVALRMLAAGASRVSLVDLYAVSLDEPGHRLMLMRDCAKLGLSPDAALSRLNVITGDIVRVPVPAPDLRADIAVSLATLEHVRDPLLVLAKCWEWLKPGGFTTHKIDLRDHSFDCPFEMLTLSDQVWDRYLNPKGGFQLNRWRVTDYLHAIHEVGFVEVGYEVLEKDETGLRRVLPRLNERFRGISLDSLSVLGVHLHGERPRC
jgi:SAM-dependent methyltransferase